jgi:hypothetical protein
MPTPPSTSGSGSAPSRTTTNEAYQCPRESWNTRTLDGADARGRDHTTGMLTPFGRRKRPSSMAKPLTVYSNEGKVFLRFFTLGRCRPSTVNESPSAFM